MGKKNAYVVIAGVRPGVYTTWSEVAPLVTGVPNNQHQGFRTLIEAQRAFAQAVAAGDVKVLNPGGDTGGVNVHSTDEVIVMPGSISQKTSQINGSRTLMSPRIPPQPERTSWDPITDSGMTPPVPFSTEYTAATGSSYEQSSSCEHHNSPRLEQAPENPTSNSPSPSPSVDENAMGSNYTPSRHPSSSRSTFSVCRNDAPPRISRTSSTTSVQNSSPLESTMKTSRSARSSPAVNISSGERHRIPGEHSVHSELLLSPATEVSQWVTSGSTSSRRLSSANVVTARHNQAAVSHISHRSSPSITSYGTSGRIRNPSRTPGATVEVPSDLDSFSSGTDSSDNEGEDTTRNTLLSPLMTFPSLRLRSTSEMGSPGGFDIHSSLKNTSSFRDGRSSTTEEPVQLSALGLSQKYGPTIVHDAEIDPRSPMSRNRCIPESSTDCFFSRPSPRLHIEEPMQNIFIDTGYY